MASLRDVSIGLYGAWRLARLDRRAMPLFDRSPAGVGRSFWAAAICYPPFVAMVILRLEPGQIDQAGLFRILLVETIGYVIAWTAFPLLMLPFCRWMGCGARVFDFIIAYNWAQVLQTALLLLAGLLLAGDVLPPQAAATLELVAYVAALGYEWFVARVALETGGLVATAIVLIDIALGTALVRITTSLY